MKSFTSTIIAAVIASSAFGGAALADRGDYYQGASKQQAADIDHTQTGSINAVRYNNGSQDLGQANQNRGDYYEGANRPN